MLKDCISHIALSFFFISTKAQRKGVPNTLIKQEIADDGKDRLLQFDLEN